MSRPQAPAAAIAARRDRGGSGWDRLCWIPLVLACLVAFFRFPIFQYDDHLAIVREISATWRWPAPGDWYHHEAQHSLVHHTLAALLHRGMEFAAGYDSVLPNRAVQALSLAWALATLPFLGWLVRRLVPEAEPRRLAVLVFGTCSGWVISSVTIDNDMAMGFWGTAALCLLTLIMGSPSLRWWPAALLGGLIGVATLMKTTAPVLLLPVALCLLSRRWYYRERLLPLLGRLLVLAAVWSGFAAPNCLRNLRSTGYLFFHRSLASPPVPADPAEYRDIFSFRLPSILARPFLLMPGSTESPSPRVDLSFWSALYVSLWQMPDYLPDRPDPWASAALLLTGLLTVAAGAAGLVAALRLLRRRPAWLPVLGWLAVGLAGLLVGKWRMTAFSQVRLLVFAAGSGLALLAAGFRWLLARLPLWRPAIWVAVELQLIVFWWLILNGPFYAFRWPWPNLTAP